MKNEKKASELFLKKYYQLNNDIELKSSLEGIPEKNYAKLDANELKTDYWINKSKGENLKDAIKSGNNSEKKVVVDTFLVKSLENIDKLAEEIKQWKEIKEKHDDFSAASYTASGVSGNAKSIDTKRRKAFRYLLDTLLDKK